MKPDNHHRSILRRALICQLAILTGWGAGASLAQSPIAHYPEGDVKLVVPSEPGGGMDGVARALAQQLTGVLGHSFIVLNRSGASGNIGTSSVARAAADGHTLLVTGISHLASPLMHADAGYDALRDFEPIALLAIAPNVLLVHASLKDLPIDRLVHHAGTDRRGLSYGSAGYGNTSHIAAELFKSRTGAQWVHVPYRGTGPAMRALMAGEIQAMFVPVSSAVSALATGRVHAVAAASARRLTRLPDVPTLAELGVKGADFAQWYALYAPAGTPPMVLDRLSSGTLAALKSGPMSAYVHDQGMQSAEMSREAFGKLVREERDRLATVVRKEKGLNAPQ